MSEATLSQAIQSAFDEVLKTVNTSIPGHVLKFDPETQLAEIQVGIKRVNKNKDQTAITPIIEVMVNFAGNDTHRIEHKIKAGTEGILIFSQRCVDSWNDQGGVAANPILRFHDMQDAYFVPGVRSQKNKLSNFVNDGIRITDGTNYLWLKDSGEVEVKGTNIKLIAEDVDIQSNTFTHNGTNVGDSHSHPQGADSAGNSQQNVGDPL